MTQRDQVRWKPDEGRPVFDPQWWSFLAAPAKRATPDEALMLARLADKALATAAEFGVSCDRREAIQRSRENLAWAHQAVLAKGIAEDETS